MGQWVGDGHKRDRAASDDQCPAVDGLKDLRNAFTPANLIAMYCTQHQQAGAGGQAVTGVGAQVVAGGALLLSHGLFIPQTFKRTLLVL